MFKKLLFALLFISSLAAYGQLNMSLVSQLQYDMNLNDIWGYAAPDGTEYAIVGARNGVSIVSLADPSNATEVAFIPGQASTWRDIKTWGTYAYVTTDQAGTTEGVTVIDLSDLPNSADYYHWTPDLPEMGVLHECHNIYIDEFGYAYLAGCNLNNGGMLYLDVFTTPGTPIYIDRGPGIYAHDVYVRDNKMYSSELYEGRMAIYDVSDKSDTQELGVQLTPYEFTHNIWISDDSNTAYTTDELANAPVAAYDISDPEDIQEVDQYRPTATLGADVIPHNVHVWEDWLIISYYTDGGIVVDASRPDNLVEVGNFDTFFGPGAGFNGVWGAYPFLPSGLVLLSDIGNGLYVLDVDYVRACFLEGTVTNAQTGAALDEVEIVIDASAEANINHSRIDGTYGTGIATAGSYEVTFTKAGFLPYTTTVDLENDVVVELDVQLIPLQTNAFSGVVQDANTSAAIANAEITISNGQVEFTTVADANGNFSIPEVYNLDYELMAAAWGYRYITFDYTVDGDENITVMLEPGYEDNFALDLGWQSINQASTGAWERGVPNGTIYNGSPSNPDMDVADDLGEQCYVTGNAPGDAPSDDVDGGYVTLSSPAMAIQSSVEEGYTPVFEYNLWFFNDGGDNNPNDELVVSITNGTDSVVVETLSASNGAWRPTSNIQVEDHIALSDDMRIHFITSDLSGSGHIVEGGVDAFNTTMVQATSTADVVANVAWRLAPNPFKNEVELSYELDQTYKTVELQVYNALGQLTATYNTNASKENMRLGQDWAKGVYFVRLVADGKNIGQQKLIKQ